MTGTPPVTVTGGQGLVAVIGTRAVQIPHRRPGAEQEAAQPRHLLAAVELHAIVRGHARKIVLPVAVLLARVIAVSAAVTQQVLPTTPQIQMQQIALRRTKPEIGKAQHRHRRPAAGHRQAAIRVKRAMLPGANRFRYRQIKPKQRLVRQRAVRVGPRPGEQNRGDLHRRPVIPVVAVSQGDQAGTVVGTQIGRVPVAGVDQITQPAGGGAGTLVKAGRERRHGQLPAPAFRQAQGIQHHTVIVHRVLTEAAIGADQALGAVFQPVTPAPGPALAAGQPQGRQPAAADEQRGRLGSTVIIVLSHGVMQRRRNAFQMHRQQRRQARLRPRNLSQHQRRRSQMHNADRRFLTAFPIRPPPWGVVLRRVTQPGIKPVQRTAAFTSVAGG